MKRALERSKLDRETNIELVETMWKQFSNLGIYELNVIDTTTHSIKDTVSAVKEKIVSGTALLILDNSSLSGGMKVGEPSADGRGSAPPELAEQQARAGSEAAPATPPL